MHDHSWPNREWRHRQYCHNHPIRTGIVWVQTQNQAVFICDVFKHLQDTLSCEGNLFLLRVVIPLLVRPLCCEFKASLAILGLESATPTGQLCG